MSQQLRTLQIATFGSDGQDGIALGIRSFPVHKLVMICFDSDKNKAEEFSNRWCCSWTSNYGAYS